MATDTYPDRDHRTQPVRELRGSLPTMKISLIGSGNIGGTLARKLTKLGHDVTIANSRGPQSLAELAAETGAKPATVAEAARAGDVVIVTITQKNVPQLPEHLFADVDERVVIVDTGNYYPRERDGAIAEIEGGATESRWVAGRLTRPVVKAFNNIYAESLMDNGKPAGTPGRIALPVAGDDPEAKAVVMELVEELGFDAIDAGTIDESWRQQPGSPVYTADRDAAGVREGLAAAKPERTPQWRATDKSPGTFENPA
ncbi:MAG: NAD(P)-binding domain-containing protein [Vulcanimicrobiaceae bacterium]